MLTITPPMNPQSTTLKANMLTIAGGVIVSMLALSVVDCGFIGGVIVSMLALSVVDCGFIGGVMVSHANHYTTNAVFDNKESCNEQIMKSVCYVILLLSLW
jgi:hypothetical protein